MSQTYTLKIGGMAGQGIKSSGLMFAKTAVQFGYSIFTHTEFPSLIRGGHNVMQITIGMEDVLSPSTVTDLLISLNQDTLTKYAYGLEPGSGIIFDESLVLDEKKLKREVSVFKMPLFKLAREAGGSEVVINLLSLGAVMALWGGDVLVLKNLIFEEFKDNKKLIDVNTSAVEFGFHYAKEHFVNHIKPIFNVVNKTEPEKLEKVIMEGNEAVALGAIAAGVQFVSIYPMSPTANILHTLAKYQEKFGYVFKQTEDEISAVNMAIGAGFAGARSMTATSGGGFCLMTEGYGLAGMTETPLVIVDGMRPGPATGMPTWSEQGDLNFVLNAHQGDFPKIVLAAGDTQEAFDLSMLSFNLAEKYQTPVILLIDKNICESYTSLPRLDYSSYKIERGKLTLDADANFMRYQLQKDGVSKRSVPGVGNFFIANSDEHTEIGYSTEESVDRVAQMQKRMAKLDTCALKDMPDPVVYGPKNADVSVVSFGSTKGSILDALKSYSNVNFLHLTWLSPFSTEFVSKFLEKAKHVIDVESNYSGQLAGLIRQKTGFEIVDKLLKFDGRPFFADEIKNKIDSVLKGKKI